MVLSSHRTGMWRTKDTQVMGCDSNHLWQNSAAYLHKLVPCHEEFMNIKKHGHEIQDSGIIHGTQYL